MASKLYHNIKELIGDSKNILEIPNINPKVDTWEMATQTQTFF